ncbi:MAG: type II secretion system minor pseudopilin GspI [Deltaproteobacteria bacterium]|nr:type II secretion system minor pseudopilin GspI [Deltaproteobacteria bacterium]
MTRRKASGFTLMEVMIAMAILAIALVAVFQSQSQSISMSTDSRFMTSAALLAQSKMAEVETSSALINHSESGDFGPDYTQYAWNLEIGDTQLPQFKKIEVTVSNKALLRGGTYKLVLYKATGM